MENDRKRESEKIQEGLESFLDQELFDSPQTSREIDLSMIHNVQKPRKVENVNVPMTKNSQTNKHIDDKKRIDPKKKKDTRKKKNKKKKKSKFKLFIFIVIIIFIAIYAWLSSMVGKAYNKMTYKEANSYITSPMKEEGVVNILLIGNDSRLNGEDGRSDAMILLSISDKTKTITMTSFLRDMYVEIPGYKGNRLNAAYSYGGPDLLMQTIEQNFDISINRYLLVNFEAFANLVDAVDGIDLELTNDEVQYVNGYLMEYNQLRGMDLATDFFDPSVSGMLHLNGPQALAYSRNRYIGTDFARTDRQRKVLSEVMKKLPYKALTNTDEIIDGLFPNLTTNLKQNECMTLTLNAWKFISYELVQQMVPIEDSYSDATIRNMSVLEVDFEANKNFLKQTIYGE